MSTTISPDFSTKSNFKLLLHYISNHKLVFWVVVIMMILNVSLAMGSPLILNEIIEVIEIRSNGGQADLNISLAIIAYIIFALLSWVFSVVQFIFVAKLTSRFVRDLRIEAYSALIHNHVSFFDEEKTGDLTSRIINDTKELVNSGNSIAWVFTSILRLLIVIAIFLYYSPIISLAALSLLPVIMGFSILLGKYERRVSEVWREKFGQVNARFQETMSKIQISKVFNRERENLDRFSEINEATFQASVKRAFAIFIFWPFTDLMKHILTLVILAVGTWQVGNGMPIATMILFLVLMNYYYWPLINIASNYHQFQGAFASLDRISKISFDPTLKENDTGNLEVNGFNGEIDFNHLSFGYSSEIEVLSDLNFTIQPGQRVAIVGHTGAGKSTIASLIMRFYSISKGQLQVDGHSIQNYNLQQYRSRISLVSQRILLFKGTIRENVVLNQSSINDDQIWEILDIVQAREFIEQLPGGLDFEVKENGKNLSIGQKQMIAFARALISDADILILDEASSAVDLYTESKITDGIDVILSERTSISIAHRLTTILKSDLIVVLEEGKIIEMGSHDELLAQDGVYAEIYGIYLETQSAKYLEKIKT